MIQVILLILKIIGIVLAVLLLTVLLVLALVLFVPVRYRARVIHNPEKDDIFGRASFLFPLVVFRFRYFEKVFSYKGKAFGFSFADSSKEKKEEQVKQKKSKKSDKDKPEEPVSMESDTAEAMGILEEEKQEEETKETLEKIVLLREKQGKTETSASKKQEKPNFFEKIKEIVLGILQKISRLLRQKDELMRILAKRETKQTLGFTWDKLKKTILHVLPKKIKGYLIYGSADPATTGQVLGIISAVYAVTGPVLRIVPDFERERLECDLEIRGRLRIFTLLVIALKVYLNQELKQLIQEIKNIKEIE